MDKSKYNEVGGGLEVDRMWFSKDEPLKKGDSLEGRYVEKKTGVGSRGSNVYIIETSDGNRVGVWGSTVIDGRFEAITKGKMVGIEYLGILKTKDGKGEYKGFWVGQGIEVVGDEGGKKKPDLSEDEEEINLDEIPF